MTTVQRGDTKTSLADGEPLSAAVHTLDYLDRPKRPLVFAEHFYQPTTQICDRCGRTKREILNSVPALLCVQGSR